MITLDVLVADHEPEVRLEVLDALRGYTTSLDAVNGEIRFNAREASTGQETLDRADAERPHILIVGQDLPDMSVLDLLEHLTPRQPDLPVLVMTHSVETATRATRCGAYDVLPEPFTQGDLRAAVGKAAQHLLLAREAKRLAEEKHHVRFQFISVLGHELRTPLDAVEGYLEIIKHRLLGDDQQAYDRMIDRCLIRTAQMHKLINDLLDLTRIETGKRLRELADLDVREPAQAAFETVAPEALEHDVTLNLDAPDPVRMVADRGELEIIFNNLVSNAVKYNRPGGRVDVAIRDEGDCVLIRVSDTGIGLTKEESARLFNDFVRIKNEKTRGILGSGLGLSIVKKLAELYGGYIRVESEPDVGSTFEVALKRMHQALTQETERVAAVG